jgi:dipeptidyl aminopeptidase/acylaminoacyl peptidase
MKKSVIIVGIIILGVVLFFLLRPSPGEDDLGGLSDSELLEEDIELSALTQLTFLDNLAADPSWSPDGSRLVFLGLEKDMMEGGLYTINDDGTGLSKIAGQWKSDHLFNPSWNPVNNKIICHGPSSGQGLGGNGLFLVDLDGDQTERTELSSQIVEYVGWSPDGEKIVYNVYNADRSFSSIWVMNADGSGQIQLTTTGYGFCAGPSFSYDGSKIVYLKGFTTTMPGEERENAINEIWIMNSDGSNKHMIYAPGNGMQLIRERAWNKNNKIIFVRHLPNKAPQIWIINSDGTNPKLIFDPEEGGIPTAIYDDVVWDNSGTKVAATKVLVNDESWHIATFSLE